MKFTFKPNIWMTLATLVVMLMCIKFGFWQYDKAQAKQVLQQKLEKGLQLPAVDLPTPIGNLEEWRYRHVKFLGTYDTEHQVLLDNQVNDTKVGYHVYTPVKIGNQNQYVLVNRGWVAGAANRDEPTVETPSGEMLFEGDISIPLAKYFTLESGELKSWQTVWQHIDLQRFAKLAPYTIKPYVVRLDAKSQAGGFSRKWPLPGDKVSMHLGYAYQWFGFALTFFVIYIVLNFKRIKYE